MRASIVTPDNRVTLDGRRVKIDLAKYGALAGIHAITADTERDRCEIEYAEVDPDGPGPLPSFKPPNELIDAATFFARFGKVIEDAGNAPDEVKPTRPVTVPGAPPVDLMPEVARAIAALDERLRSVERFRDAMEAEAKDVAARGE